MRGSLNLTGAWAADDGAIYYIRHLEDKTIWWAGLHNSGFHLGLKFTNVFRGLVDLRAETIEGAWADVPRGWGVLQQGRLSLAIVQNTEPQPPSGVPRGPSGRRIELRQRPEGTTGGFAGSVWTQWFSQDPVEIRESYKHVRRIGGVFSTVFSDDNAPFKDFAVVSGKISPNPARLNWSNLNRDYCTFVGDDPGECVDPETGETGDCDGDLLFNIADPLYDPDFWMAGWIDSSAHWKDSFNLSPPSAAARIQHHLANNQNQFHCEAVMFGRTNSEDDCRATPNVLLPGWMETLGNSVLVNGLPIAGNVFSESELSIVLFSPELPGTQIRKQLKPESQVYVTGVINLDEHDIVTFGENGRPLFAGNPEIHPVYAIDLAQNFHVPRPGADLTGAWHSDDGGTYYLRQIDTNTIWWLGLSRDQGRTFANVFYGTLSPDANAISGDWVDVPAGVGGARSSGRLVLTGDGRGPLAAKLTKAEQTGGFGGSTWLKIYDRPFR
jgi:hypothetical protein